MENLSSDVFTHYLPIDMYYILYNLSQQAYQSLDNIQLGDPQ